MIDENLLRTISIVSIPAITAITIHEWAHGWVASLRGDNSAKMLGRLSLNPIKHIDPIGTVLVPITLLIINTGFLFGWAKPVPVNENSLRNPRWDMALVAFAGPLSNIIMAIVWLILAKYIASAWLYNAAKSGLIINTFLAALNILPILPLDGGRILSALMPRKLVYYYDQTESYGLYILIILMLTGVITKLVQPIMSIIINFINLLLT